MSNLDDIFERYTSQDPIFSNQRVDHLRHFAEYTGHEFELIRKDNDRMVDRISMIEKRLYILERDIKLESEFDELKNAYYEYKRIEEKLLVFSTLQRKSDE